MVESHCHEGWVIFGGDRRRAVNLNNTIQEEDTVPDHGEDDDRDA